MVKHWIAVLVVSHALAVPSTVLGQTFGYFGPNGPRYWATLSPDWAACGAGEIQSPVDFGKLAPRSRALTINYDPNTTGEIFNNGHTIEVEVAEASVNLLTLDGVDYELDQFHFHSASEHRFADRGFDMEMHLVHKAADGSTAVIGVFLKRALTSGALTPIFAALPDDINVHHPLDAPFNPATFLPARQTHFSYLGSLTTPPCTEGVNWVVMTETVTVSDEDMAQFAERIHFNARPVQRQARPMPPGSR
jgi:carbonic anhydrase